MDAGSDKMSGSHVLFRLSFQMSVLSAATPRASHQGNALQFFFSDTPKVLMLLLGD